MAALEQAVTWLATVNPLVTRAVWLAVSVLALALVSAIESALGGVDQSRAQSARERKLANAAHLKLWLDAPGRILMTLTVLRLLLIVGITLAGVRIADALEINTLTMVLVLCGVLLLLGRVIPSGLVKRHALTWSLATIRVVRVFTWLLYPLVWPALLLLELLARLAGSHRPEPLKPIWTRAELGRLAADSETMGLGEPSRELLRSILEFSDTVIREIMVPRTEMVAVPVDATVEDVRQVVTEGGHSRVPVYDTTFDRILGILYVKDFSAAERQQQFDLHRLVRPTFYVPEVMKISDVLREFQRRKTHLAIVVDEYGGTAGLVTLEDIIEEIVGEIHDEYDVEEKQFRTLADNKIIADGRVSLWDLEQTLGVEFPEGGAYETLAGFITARLGYLPEPGTVVSWNNLRFTVKEANERRIGTVEIERRQEGAPALAR